MFIFSNHMIRQIVLDTETTGMNRKGSICKNHKIIEIGAVELINRKLTGNNFHIYLNPNRKVDLEAFKIHGISDSFLKKKPTFREISTDFLNYIKNSDLIIHNADFDFSFIQYEFKFLNIKIQPKKNFLKLIDTLIIARKLFPGKKNSLDALCSRYQINNNNRKLHSAIIDAKLLARVYLLMTSSQEEINFELKESNVERAHKIKKKHSFKKSSFSYLFANDQEKRDHNFYLKEIRKKFGKCLWIDSFKK
ncbi:DNA polymerase III subunit epsilon [Buchnera aphidicola (Mindarus keteleerifoliae)]|uniref:DNA polymerase III subunit epsilon n=1 Tax=Buchnera aphidicola TaxID=9 RepID=UPI0031B6A446